ncbi:MAG: hypothetical protein ACI4I6_09955 [Hominimerdicola sp.]
MKYCPECERIFDDNVCRCPDCDCFLKKSDSATEINLTKKVNQKLNVSLGLAPSVAEIIFCVILAVEGIISLIFSLKNGGNLYMLLVLNLLMIIVVMFKGFIFRHFTWQSLLARFSGQDVKKIYPSTFYKIVQKIALVFWTIFSTVSVITII